MTEQNINIRQEIKDAVNESLIDAITEANGRVSRSATNILLVVLQIIVVPLIGWLLWTSVEIQKDIVLMRYQLQEFNTNLEKHIITVEDGRESAILLHHSLKGSPICSECHIVANSFLKSRTGQSKNKKKIEENDN